MKKLFVIPLMLVYLVAISGIMISVHYCGQQMESWSFFSAKEGCADGACGDESKKSDDCCKDEVLAAKVSQEQNIASAFKLKSFTQWVDVLLPVYPHIQHENIPATTAATNSNMPNAPPGLWQQIPLFKLHSSFTYYG